MNPTRVYLSFSRISALLISTLDTLFFLFLGILTRTADLISPNCVSQKPTQRARKVPSILFVKRLNLNTLNETSPPPGGSAEPESGPSLWPADRHKRGRCAADCTRSQLFNQCYFPLTSNNIQVSGPGNTNPSPPKDAKKEEFLDLIQKVYPPRTWRIYPLQFARARSADPPKRSNGTRDRHR